MWRIKKMLFVLAFVLSTVSAYSQFSGGDGTEGNPYQVSTAAELDSVRAYADANFILMNDVDLTDYLTDGNPGYNGGNFWDPIGNSSVKFTGRLDGNGFQILNLKINRYASSDVGLFGMISNAEIVDLGVVVDPASSVNGYNDAGTVIGYSENSVISGCYSIGLVNGAGNYVGGFIGWNTSSSVITDCYSEGEVHGNEMVGGFAGFTSNDADIFKSGTSCSVYGNGSTGGFTGCAAYIGSTISGCYSTGGVNCFYEGVYAGGFVGYNYSEAVISDCYSRSNVSGGAVVGGFIGGNYSFTINSYSTGTATGMIPGTVNGFCGSFSSGSITDCYWDTESSLIITDSYATGKTTAEMKLESTFTGWDFDTKWIINPAVNNGYPILVNSYIDPVRFASGDGTEGNPYQLSTAEQLYYVRYYLDSYFIVINDIDMTPLLTETGIGYSEGTFWKPIGNGTTHFSGKFNGNSHKISGLKINRPAQDNIGLFGSIDTGMIYDLSVEIDTVSEVKGNVYTGGLAGKSINSSIINCQITGSVTGNYNVGGLVGWNQESTVTDSRSFTYTTGNNQTGGLIGVNASGIVTNCHSNGTVTASGVMSGGLIGQQYNGEITQCSSAGTVNSTFSECGGLIGWAEYFTISKCFTSVNVNIDGASCTSIGGFVGSANGTDETITECYATGNVLTNCSGVVGGFAGYLNCSVSRCYSIGQVTGTGQIGGFIGDSAAGSSTGPDCYWDIEKSGVSESEGGVGKTTAEMQSIATYTGWDFTTTPIWAINEYLNDGYPYFNWDKNFYFAGGNGRPDNPFLIATPDHLNNVRNGMYANYRQTADIDLGVSPWKDGEGWNPIGYYNSDTDYGPFRGIYDGNVFIITNLTINRPLSHSTGLFGYIYQSTITNFNLQGVNVVGGIENTGALAGMVNNGNVFNSVSNGSVQGGNFTGGLIGYNTSGSTIENCSTYGSVSSSGEYTGGLVGLNYNVSIINRCFSNGDVLGTTVAGGLAGMNSGDSEINESYSTGAVYGVDGIGGFIGNEGDGSKVERCFALGDVTSTGTSAGGFIGLVFSTSEVNDSYSRGNVNGDINVGGFIGYNHTSTLTNCYSTGTVSAVTGPAGGFAAFNFASTITASYWDTETSGQSASAGGIGKTTDDMTYLFGSDVYTGWNFDTVWVGSYNNNDAYPHLAWQGLTGIEEDSNLPKVTELYQNYPNPFNPVTEIKFALNKDTDVNLTVYNSNGQMVKELVKDNLSAGYHKASFDASGLNSGLYFYRLNYGNKSISRKMIMIK